VRLFAFLFLAAVLVALAVYDYRAYTEAKRMVTDINTITQDLNIRGQQRFISYQKLLGTELNLSDYKAGAVARPSKNIPQNENIDVRSRAAINWDSINELFLLRQKINFSITQHQSIITPDQDHNYYVFDDSQATQGLIADLEKIQNINTRLADDLSDNLLSSLPRVVGVNVGALLAIFLIYSAMVYRDNLKESKRNLEKNKQLESRHEEALQSRTMMLSIMEDLSDEKRTAEHLSTMLESSNRSIKSKNQEMEQFIYTVSHDLKSPLVSIGGFSSILNRELADDLTEKQAHYLSRIQSNVTDMESLLGDLLELSRVTKQEFKRSTIDTDSHLTSLLGSFERELNEIEGEIELETPLDEVFANERLLRQCLSNLISNAITYRSNDRPLKIAIASIKSPAYTTISVKDNGIGIDKKFHDLVFRIFEHLDSSVGTGVGLTIVKTVLERHGGSVYLESELGRGSTVYLRFPSKEQIRNVA